MRPTTRANRGMKIAAAFITLGVAPFTFGQTAQNAMSAEPPDWHTFIFVSSSVPATSLVQLASDASRAHAVLVINGFTGPPGDLEAMRHWVADIKSRCCQNRPVDFIIHPKLFTRYHISAVPAFVVGYADSDQAGDYSQISGDMSLANALKFIAQESQYPRLRQRARAVYEQAFAE